MNLRKGCRSRSFLSNQQEIVMTSARCARMDTYVYGLLIQHPRYMHRHTGDTAPNKIDLHT
jgi:hypothetical protein